ncbi:MAG: hypothetical protein LBP62_03095 [Clostridiales bacterium]|nr:hypothetical protein [Clostridiales bacterium]
MPLKCAALVFYRHCRKRVEFQIDVTPHPFDPLPRRGIADNLVKCR